MSLKDRGTTMGMYKENVSLEAFIALLTYAYRSIWLHRALTHTLAIFTRKTTKWSFNSSITEKIKYCYKREGKDFHLKQTHCVASHRISYFLPETDFWFMLWEWTHRLCHRREDYQISWSPRFNWSSYQLIQFRVGREAGAYSNCCRVRHVHQHIDTGKHTSDKKNEISTQSNTFVNTSYRLLKYIQIKYTEVK